MQDPTTMRFAVRDSNEMWTALGGSRNWKQPHLSSYKTLIESTVDVHDQWRHRWRNNFFPIHCINQRHQHCGIVSKRTSNEYSQQHSSKWLSTNTFRPNATSISHFFNNFSTVLSSVFIKTLFLLGLVCTIYIDW